MHPGRGTHVHHFIHIKSELTWLYIITGPVKIQFEVCVWYTLHLKLGLGWDARWEFNGMLFYRVWISARNGSKITKQRFEHSQACWNPDLPFWCLAASTCIFSTLYQCILKKKKETKRKKEETKMTFQGLITLFCLFCLLNISPGVPLCRQLPWLLRVCVWVIRPPSNEVDRNERRRCVCVRTKIWNWINVHLIYVGVYVGARRNTFDGGSKCMGTEMWP